MKNCARYIGAVMLLTDCIIGSRGAECCGVLERCGCGSGGGLAIRFSTLSGAREGCELPRKLRLRGGADGGMEVSRYGPFMCDEEREREFRAELGLNACDEDFEEPEPVDIHLEHLLDPEYITAAMARTSAPETYAGDDGLYLISMANGVSLNFKYLPSAPTSRGALDILILLKCL
jgi:hypothetical protein